MCMICHHDAKFEEMGSYNVCTYCDSYIAKVLPDAKKIQDTLESHADTYVLGNNDNGDRQIYDARLALLKKYALILQSIVDFGSGKGNFVRYVRDLGYKAFAYDKSKRIQKYLAQQLILQYKNLSDIPDRAFDVITCFDVIEHTTKPQEILEIIHKKLKRTGIVMLTTPNARGISARVLGSRWWVFGPEGHYILYSPKSIRILLNRYGFEILDSSTDIITPWFFSDKFLPSMVNHAMYWFLRPFNNILFKNNLGDNIQVIAKLK